MGRCNGIFMHRIFISYILSILLAVLVLLLMEEMVGTVENMEKERGSSFCGVDRHRMGTDGNGITTLVVFMIAHCGANIV